MRTALLVDRPVPWLDTLVPAVERAGVTVAAQAGSPGVALDLVARHAPDLLVTGLAAPEAELGGLALVRAARARVPHLRALVLGRSADAADIEAAFAAGACAYVLETAHVDDVTSAVRQAFDPSVYVAGVVAPAAVVPLEQRARLTRRELEILQLMAEGHSNGDLARMLWVTEQTVKFHLSNVYRKLGVSNRTEASRWAQRAGLLSGAARAPAAA